MRRIFCLLIALFSFSVLSAQISPPGLGKAKTAGWFAAGVKKNLSEKWQSMTYFGLGRKSSESALNPVGKASIMILNQEFYHQFQSKWKYSFALSYRNQLENEEELNRDFNVQELRFYSRVSYEFKTSVLKFTPTFRHPTM